jgi:Tfp pilus assembly protein PilN
VAALVASGVLGVQIARGQIAERQTAARRIEETKALRAEVAQLRNRESEVNELQAEVSALTPSRAAGAALLRAISRSLPPQIVLTNLRADREGFAVTGGVWGSGLSEKDWKAWIDSLQPPGGPWQLTGSVAGMPTADFALKGVWR